MSQSPHGGSYSLLDTVKLTTSEQLTCSAYNSVFSDTKCAVGNSECVVGIYLRPMSSSFFEQ